MANSFTSVLPTIVAQSLLALREQAIITRVINRDFENTPVAWGDVVNVTLPNTYTTSAVSPQAAPVTGADSTPIKVPITLNQWKKVNMYLTDKEFGMITAGILPSQLSAMIRAIVNDVNSYFYGLYWKVYGFAGTAGTVPFNGGTSADVRTVRKVLNQQLAPDDDLRALIITPSAEASAYGVSDIARWDARGAQAALIAGQINGFMHFRWFMDQLVARHVSTALTAGAATVNGAHTVGQGSTDLGRTGTVSIAKATNSSPLVHGDILTFAGDSQTYAVQADVTLAVGNTSVTIAPALTTAKSGGEAMTLTASHTANLAFHRDAIYFASRPLNDLQGSANTFSMADPQTGLVLRAEIVRQHKQNLLELDVLYGGEVVRPELACRLAGE
jgi:hypothetical protein